MKRTPFAIAALCGLCAAASAQPAWETRIRYRIQGTNQLAAGTTLPIFAPGTYTMIVQAGIFNLTGLGPDESNQGLFEWGGRIVATGLSTTAGDTLGVNPFNSRFAPFTFGPSTTFAGYVTAGGTVIEGSAALPGSHIHAARDLIPGSTRSCIGPDPTAPDVVAGVESYANVFRFTITVQSMSGADIVIVPEGSAGPILRWILFATDECCECDIPHWIAFMGLTATPALAPYSPQPLTLVRCPLRVTPLPAAQTFASGQAINLHADATTPLAPVTYQWRRNGVPLTDGPRITGSTAPALTITPALAADSGSYDVLVGVPCGMLPPLSTSITVTCRADWDGDGTVQPADVAAFIAAWFQSLPSGTLAGDFDGNGAVEPADVAAFIIGWFGALSGSC